MINPFYTNPKLNYSSESIDNNLTQFNEQNAIKEEAIKYINNVEKIIDTHLTLLLGNKSSRKFYEFIYQIGHPPYQGDKDQEDQELRRLNQVIIKKPSTLDSSITFIFKVAISVPFILFMAYQVYQLVISYLTDKSLKVLREELLADSTCYQSTLAIKYQSAYCVKLVNVISLANVIIKNKQEVVKLDHQLTISMLVAALVTGGALYVGIKSLAALGFAACVLTSLCKLVKYGNDSFSRWEELHKLEVSLKGVEEDKKNSLIPNWEKDCGNSFEAVRKKNLLCLLSSFRSSD